VPQDNESRRIAELEDTVRALSDSLLRCRKLVSEFHARLAVNSNEDTGPALSRNTADEAPPGT
jgi:hypothetical protein